jgi:hypothetical protein
MRPCSCPTCTLNCPGQVSHLTLARGEGGAVTNGAALVCESEAALSDRVIGDLDCGGAAVGERFADEPPKVIGRLELGTMGGQHEPRATPIKAVTASLCAGLGTASGSLHGLG